MEKVKGLTQKQKVEAKEVLKEKALAETKVSPEDMKKLKEMMELAKMPIVIKDKDMKINEGEVDIRELSDANFKQMIFRLFVLNNVYMRDLCTSMVDLLRLVMIMLRKSGVENVTEEMDKLLEDLAKEVQQDKKA